MKTSGLLISDFFRSRVMPFSTMLLSFTWIAIAWQKKESFGSRKISGMKRLSSGKSTSRSRIACTTHSVTVTLPLSQNAVELATLRGEHLAYLGQLDHEAKPHRCGIPPFPRRCVFPELHLSVST